MLCALCMLQTQVPAERVTSLAFSPDGATLAAGCWGGAIFLYHRAGSRWAGTRPAQPCSSATPAPVAAVPSEAALPAQDLSAGPPGAAGAAASPEAVVSAAPAAQLARTKPPSKGAVMHVGAVGGAAEAGACAPAPGQASQASGLAAVDHGTRGSGGWVVGKGCAAQADPLSLAVVVVVAVMTGPHIILGATVCTGLCCSRFCLKLLVCLILQIQSQNLGVALQCAS